MARNSNLSITKNLQAREITLERLVHGPRELAWEGWTKPEHIARWWGPEGWETIVQKMDVQPGGIWHFCMRPRDTEGNEVWGLATYHDVTKPSHLKYTEAASNAAGETIDGKQHTVTVEFTELDPATTKVTIRTQFKTVADLEVMERMGMAEGYGGALDKLEVLITNLA